MRTENETPARGPLDPAALRRAAVRPGGLWRAVEVVESTGSTNADLLARALRGEPEGTVLVTEHQRAGRGRMGRTWITPPRAALTFSLLVRPAVPPARRGWLPLLTGVAVAEAVTGVTAVPATLKWPNDVLADATQADASQADASQADATQADASQPHPGKLCGILAEASGDAIVTGIGLNVSTELAELPERGPGALPAVSLRVAGRAGGNPGPGHDPARHPGRLRALVPGLERGRRRPGSQRPARRVHQAVRHDRPSGTGRTPRRSGALRLGRRRRRGRQAAGPLLVGRRGRGSRRRRRPPALIRRGRPGANASAAARQAAGTAGTR